MFEDTTSQAWAVLALFLLFLLGLLLNWALSTRAPDVSRLRPRYAYPYGPTQ